MQDTISINKRITDLFTIIPKIIIHATGSVYTLVRIRQDISVSRPILITNPSCSQRLNMSQSLSMPDYLIRCFRKDRPRLRHVSRKLSSTGTSFFCCNQNNSITGTGTVQSGRSSILQHFHRFNRRRVNFGQCIRTCYRRGK